ncbi:tartrate transporter [Brucella neotomae]|nr:major Facilitator Superfamily protein [Brucella neotomae 5K33]SPU68482.1 tartrate transporter [Brucella neotomae]SPU69961.1 tartrate transporter [Brucella neotomae]SUW61228.1 tartrate transporter [Brucella neotomae]
MKNSNTAITSPEVVENMTYRKVAFRIIPLLMICYIIAYLDRVNVGFAKLQMSEELGFSEAIYGLGAGLFFIGYFFFEIPSNILLHKLGARLWIARIMITWGLLSACLPSCRRNGSFIFCASCLVRPKPAFIRA